MICTQCGAENPDDANFCGSCGTSIGSAFDSPAGPVTSLGGYDEGEESASEISVEGAVVESEEVVPPPMVEPPPEPEPVPKPPSFSEPMPIPTHMPEPPPQPPQPQRPVNPNHPGAGLAPPPPPPGSFPQQQEQQGYGYSMPADGNTSGMGESYPIPPEAEGWTFGSFIPCGLFSFINGNSLWGILYWVSWFFGLTIIYIIYVGIYGKKQAWQGRRFDSMQQYVDTMSAWNTWGLVLVVFVIVANIMGFLFFMAFFAAFSEEMASPGSF